MLSISIIKLYVCKIQRFTVELPCNHSVCNFCLQERGKNSRKTQCPSCRKPIPAKFDGNKKSKPNSV